MGWRRVLEEFEADLYKVPMPRFFRVEKGELERKKYADGEERLEIAFRGADAPDGAHVSVYIDGAPVCQIEVRRGRGRGQLSTMAGEAVPEVKAGQVAEVRYQERVLLRGTFQPD